MTDQLPDEIPASAPINSRSGMRFQRQILIAGGLLAGAIALIFVVGLLLALFSDVEATAARMSVLRDLFIIVLALEFIVIIGALVVLILQIARLIYLLQQDVRPVLKNTQETVASARGAISFVGDNVARPVIRLGAFMAGASVLIREVGGIRRAVRQAKPAEADEQNTTAN